MEFNTLVFPNTQAGAVCVKDQASQGSVVSFLAVFMLEASILCIQGATLTL